MSYTPLLDKIRANPQNGAQPLSLADYRGATIAARFADQIVLLDHGQIVAVGSAVEVLTLRNIRAVFGVNPTLIPVEPSGFHLIFD